MARKREREIDSFDFVHCVLFLILTKHVTYVPRRHNILCLIWWTWIAKTAVFHTWTPLEHSAALSLRLFYEQDPLDAVKLREEIK